MHEIAIHDLEGGIGAQQFQQVLAHVHQRGRAAGGPVEAAKNFLPPRLGRIVDGGASLVARFFRPRLDGLAEFCGVGSKLIRQRAEESEFSGLIQRRVILQKLARKRCARRLASP